MNSRELFEELRFLLSEIALKCGGCVADEIEEALTHLNELERTQRDAPRDAK